MGQSSSSGLDNKSKTRGYRVLGVQPLSPASSAGLVSFFDFLVGCQGRMLLGGLSENPGEEEDMNFISTLKENLNRPLELLVFNIKSQSTRIVEITPSADWGGHGLLGVTIRFDDYSMAEERLVRVLSVREGSPAQLAGMQPNRDYLLGTRTVSFSSDVVLGNVLKENKDKNIDVYAYDTETDLVRVLELTPMSWEGDGLLGAEVGTGYLHRLPSTCRDTDGISHNRAIVNNVTSQNHNLPSLLSPNCKSYTEELLHQQSPHQSNHQEQQEKHQEEYQNDKQEEQQGNQEERDHKRNQQENQQESKQEQQKDNNQEEEQESKNEDHQEEQQDSNQEEQEDHQEEQESKQEEQQDTNQEEQESNQEHQHNNQEHSSSNFPIQTIPHPSTLQPMPPPPPIVQPITSTAPLPPPIAQPTTSTAPLPPVVNQIKDAQEPTYKSWASPFFPPAPFMSSSRA